MSSRSNRLQYNFDPARTKAADVLLNSLYPDVEGQTVSAKEGTDHRRLERKFYLSQQLVPATGMLSKFYSYDSFKRQLSAGQDPKSALATVSRRVGALDLGIVTTLEHIEAAEPVLWDTTYVALSGGTLEGVVFDLNRPTGHAERVAGLWNDFVRRAHERRDRYAQLFSTSAQFEASWRLAALGTEWFKQLDPHIVTTLYESVPGKS